IDLLFEERRTCFRGFQLTGSVFELLLDLRKSPVTQFCGFFPIAGAGSFFFLLPQLLLLFFKLLNTGNGGLLGVPSLSQPRSIRAQLFEITLDSAETLAGGFVF